MTDDKKFDMTLADSVTRTLVTKDKQYVFEFQALPVNYAPAILKVFNKFTKTNKDKRFDFKTIQELQGKTEEEMTEEEKKIVTDASLDFFEMLSGDVSETFSELVDQMVKLSYPSIGDVKRKRWCQNHLMMLLGVFFELHNPASDNAGVEIKEKLKFLDKPEYG